MSEQTQPFGPGSSSGSAQQTSPARGTRRARRTGPASDGTASDGTVRISDIKAKLSEIDAEVRGATEVEGPGKRGITLAAVGVVVGIVILAFILGRKRGRRTTTWVEVRRL